MTKMTYISDQNYRYQNDRYFFTKMTVTKITVTKMTVIYDQMTDILY